MKLGASDVAPNTLKLETWMTSLIFILAVFLAIGELFLNLNVFCIDCLVNFLFKF